jgi:ankyrin repeat protein
MHKVECAQALLDAGADIHNRKRDTGKQIIHWSVVCVNLEMLKFLVQRGADINSPTSDGETPLHIAVLDHESDIVNWLVEEGADVNAQDGNGDTPLHIAARDG